MYIFLHSIMFTKMPYSYLLCPLLALKQKLRHILPRNTMKSLAQCFYVMLNSCLDVCVMH